MRHHETTSAPLAILGMALAFAAAAPALADEANPMARAAITVMTQNLYMGAEVAPVIEAVLGGNPEDVPFAVAEVWAKVKATDFPTRARGIASEIARVQPDLVGLQEAVIWRTQDPADSIGPDPTPATHVEYDFVATLLGLLKARGLVYEPVVISTGFDAEMPAVTEEGGLVDVRVTEREVLLVRTGHGSKNLQLTNRTAGHFATIVAFPEAGIFVDRGWVSADGLYQGRRFRVVSTHLEADSEEVRVAQAEELLAGPLVTDLPLVLMGDLNSNAAVVDASSAAYLALVGSGLADSWKTLLPGLAGYTCCQDELLRNTAPTLDQRIDLVLHRGRIRLVDVDLLGERTSDRVGGLWPSDHAGVAATFELK